MILTEYDAKQHIEEEKSESYLEGKADGEARLLRLMDLMEADGRAEQSRFYVFGKMRNSSSRCTSNMA